MRIPYLRASLLALALVAFGTTAHADLLGSSVNSQYYAYGGVYDGLGSPTSFVANGSVQQTFCAGCIEGYNLTVSGTQVDYTFLANNGLWSPSGPSYTAGGLFIANGNLLTFSGVTITGVTLDPASNLGGFTASNVTFNAQNIAVDWAGLTGISAGQSVILDVTTTGGSGGGPMSTTPEPSSILLLGTGLLGAAGILRRRYA